MLENSLMEIEFKALWSLSNEIKYGYLDGIDKLNISIDSAYDTVKKIFNKNTALTVFGMDIDTLLENLKYPVMVYSCYYAMDYIYGIEHPNGTQFNPAFIKEFYDCPRHSDIYMNIMNNIKKNLTKIPNVLSYPDPNHVNPYIGFIHEKNTDGYNHIYGGSILTYLKRAFLIDEDGGKKYIHSISPSVVFLALKILGYLPNGGNTNKSKKDISLTTVKVIDNAINGGAIFENKEEGKPYAIVQNRILYIPCDDEIAEIINFVLFDDLFKIERINAALACYDTYIKNERAENLTWNNEYFAACVCSLLLEVPFSILTTAKGFIEKFLKREIEDSKIKTRKKYMEELFLLISFVFPAMVGTFCSIIFGIAHNDQEKDIVKNRIKEISLLIKNDKQKDEYLKKKSHIWSDATIIYSSKSRYENYNKYHWCNDKHKIDISEILGIMMNETYDTARIKSLLDENYARGQEQYYYAVKLLFHGKSVKGLNNELFEPLEYAKKLTADFLNEIKKNQMRHNIKEDI